MNRLALVFVAMGLTSGKATAATTLDDLLARGPVVQVQSKKNAFDTATGLINVAAPPEVVWKVLTDFGNYHQFMPKVVESLVKDRRGTSVTVEFEIEVPGANTEYVLSYDLDERRHEVRARWVEGDLEGSRWLWRLEPIAGGARTRIHYQASIKNFSSILESVEDDQQTITIGVNVATILAAVRALRREAERVGS